MEPVKIGIVGVGGYGASCLNSIQQLEEKGVLKLTVAVIRSPQKYEEKVAELTAAGVVIRASLAEMLEKDRDKVELVNIPTGIDNHRDALIETVEAGYPVVLEKPTAATIQDIDAMRDALARTGQFCQIGFQSQSDSVVRKLKRAICDGRLGTIREVIVKGMWTRKDSYYTRNPWAGAYMMNDKYILDGTINNPMAHYLFNGLFFAGMEWNQAAEPVTVRAELYRGHKIESEDTSCLEVSCASGAKVYFYGTLCSPEASMPTMEVIGDKARACYEANGAAQIYEGDTLVEEIPFCEEENGRHMLFKNAAQFLRGEADELTCPLEMTRAHVLAVNGAFESARAPVTVAADSLEREPDPENPDDAFTYITGIQELIARCAKERKLFSDMGAPWAKATQPFSLENYTHYDIAPPVG